MAFLVRIRTTEYLLIRIALTQALNIGYTSESLISLHIPHGEGYFSIAFFSFPFAPRLGRSALRTPSPYNVHRHASETASQRLGLRCTRVDSTARRSQPKSSPGSLIHVPVNAARRRCEQSTPTRPRWKKK